MRKTVRGILLLQLLFAGKAEVNAAVNLTSGDGFVRSEANSWLIGTALVEKRVSLEHGRFSLASFRNQSSHHEYRDGGPDPDEIRFSLDGQDNTGAAWAWNLIGDRATRLAQGELQLDIQLRAGAIEATKHYVIYPKTAVIREWVTIQNQSAKPVKLTNLCFLNSRLMGSSADDLQLSYVTGGGNYNGGQMLKTEHFSRSTNPIFDSHDGPQ